MLSANTGRRDRVLENTPWIEKKNSASTIINLSLGKCRFKWIILSPKLKLPRSRARSLSIEKLHTIGANCARKRREEHYFINPKQNRFSGTDVFNCQRRAHRRWMYFTATRNSLNWCCCKKKREKKTKKTSKRQPRLKVVEIKHVSL